MKLWEKFKGLGKKWRYIIIVDVIYNLNSLHIRSGQFE